MFRRLLRRRERGGGGKGAGLLFAESELPGAEPGRPADESGEGLGIPEAALLGNLRDGLIASCEQSHSELKPPVENQAAR